MEVITSSNYGDEEYAPPTGLERLAGLLAATKEDASAEISKLSSQVQALDVERRTLEAELDRCRDELGDAKSLVTQLRLENTRKWRVEERDDWRALVDSMQADRNALQEEKARLEKELKRCITTLRPLFPASSRGDPPELTHRTVTIGRDHRNASVDVMWLDALAKEFDIADVEEDQRAGFRDAEENGVGESADGRAVAAGTEKGSKRMATSPGGLRPGMEKDVHDKEVERLSLEVKVKEQEEELGSLRADVARLKSAANTNGGQRSPSAAASSKAPPAPGLREGRRSAGVLGWWKRGDAKEGDVEARAGSRDRAGSMRGTVTVV